MWETIEQTNWFLLQTNWKEKVSGAQKRTLSLKDMRKVPNWLMMFGSNKLNGAILKKRI